MSVRSWAAQNASAPSAQPPLAITDMVAKIGSEADARAVLITVLSHAMAQSRTEFFLASQMRPDWLPVVRRAEFVRLADNDVASHLASCGTYWIIDTLERTDSVVSLMLRRKCGGRS